VDKGVRQKLIHEYLQAEVANIFKPEREYLQAILYSSSNPIPVLGGWGLVDNGKWHRVLRTAFLHTHPRAEGLNAMYGTTARAAVGTTAKTGSTCPESGIWKVMGSPTTTAPIAKGNRMPPYGGASVTWQLIQLA
jgi:hypothetical protein